MAFPLVEPANAIDAVTLFRNTIVAAGYTPASGMSMQGALYATVANLMENFSWQIGAGTVSAPSIYVFADTDTGFYFTTNAVRVTAGGVQAAHFLTATTGVNYFTFTPTAASANPSLAAAGADTNISLALAGKGTGGVIVGSGTPVAGIRMLALTLTPAALAASTAVVQTFTATGITTSDFVVGVQKAAAQAGLVIGGAYYSAADKICIHFGNCTASAITPTSGEVYKVFAAAIGTDD